MSVYRLVLVITALISLCHSKVLGQSSTKYRIAIQSINLVSSDRNNIVDDYNSAVFKPFTLGQSIDRVNRQNLRVGITFLRYYVNFPLGDKYIQIRTTSIKEGVLWQRNASGLGFNFGKVFSLSNFLKIEPSIGISGWGYRNTVSELFDSIVSDKFIYVYENHLRYSLGFMFHLLPKHEKLSQLNIDFRCKLYKTGSINNHISGFGLSWTFSDQEIRKT